MDTEFRIRPANGLSLDFSQGGQNNELRVNFAVNVLGQLDIHMVIKEILAYSMGKSKFQMDCSLKCKRGNSKVFLRNTWKTSS